VDCQDTKTGLSPYLDGELPREDAAAIGAHLAQCEGCRLLLDELRLVGAALRSQLIKRPILSTGVRGKVRAALAQFPGRCTPRRGVWRTRWMWRRLSRTLARTRAR